MTPEDDDGGGAKSTLRRILPTTRQPSHDVTGRDILEAQHSDGVLTDEEKSFEIKMREQVIREKDDELQRSKDEHGLRKLFLHFVFWFVVGFVIVVLTYLGLCATGVFTLANTVLITLLSTTTVNVVGLLYIAFKWLFPKR